MTVSSDAVAIIKRNHINFIVPDSEFVAGVTKYRLTAFGHDGNFTAGDRGADVTGQNPTEPLRRLEPAL